MNSGMMAGRVGPVLAAAVVMIALAEPASADLFVRTTGGNIGEYTSAGAAVNTSLVSVSGPGFIAVSGGYIYTTNADYGSISQYNLSGAVVAQVLVRGLSGPAGIVVSGGNLYVSNASGGTIGEYNATTGATVNASLVSGIGGSGQMVVYGGNIYVAEGNIGEYNATTGAVVNNALIPGFVNATGVAVCGGHLYVADGAENGWIGEYNLDGTTVNAALITGLLAPRNIVGSGGQLFVANLANGNVGEYNLDGTVVNAALIPLSPASPDGLAVGDVPEPATMGLLAVGLAALVARRRRVTGCKS